MLLECFNLDVFSPWRAYKDIPMQFRDIGDRCWNFAERDAVFQFLKLSSKACQPSELRYFRAKKFKSCFQDQAVMQDSGT